MELLQSTSRNLILTIGAIYLTWHFIATLSWPAIFSPSLWLISLIILTISALALRLVARHFLLAQVIWFGGLTGALFYAYYLYQRPEIMILLVFLPLISFVTVGRFGTVLVEALIFLLISFQPHFNIFPPLPPGYQVGVVLGSIFTAVFGWGLSSNLLTAIDSSSYHFKQARKLLEETRQHRAEISKMLKHQHQANYQLERLNQMLHFARTQADEAREDRDRFILAVSHELRSPLNFVIGFSDLMVNSPETYAPLDDWPAGLYDDIQEIYRSSSHLLGLINDILDMGQIDARQMIIFREKFHLEQIVDEVRSMAEPAFIQKGLYLRCEYASDLPDVYVDRIRVRQVILNLVNNGLRFTERGGVTIRLQPVRDFLQVQVEDTGSGISAEDVPKVFDEFRQVGQENWRRREGSGLGLSISKRFIDLHGGRMWLESEVGRGSRFYFTVPMMDGKQAEPLETGMEEILVPRDSNPNRVRQDQVLFLISEQPRAAKILAQCVSDHQILPVEELEALPSLVERIFPRSVLIDHPIRGAERAIFSKIPYDLPIIYFSLTGGHHADGELPEGVVNYLVKPVTRPILVDAVERLGATARNLLVVDDDPAMVRFVTQALKSPLEDPSTDEYVLYTAYTGGEALEILQDQPIDAILLDLDLPDINGWQVMAKIQQEGDLAHLPIIIISAEDKPRRPSMEQREVFSLSMRREFSQQEVADLLKPLLANVQPVLPKPVSSTARVLKSALSG